MIILMLMWMKMIMLIIDYQCWWWWFSGDLLLCFHAPRGLSNQCNRLQSFRFQDNHDHDYDQHKVLSGYFNPLKSWIYDIGPSVISAAMGILWMSSTLWNSDSGLCRIVVSTLSEAQAVQVFNHLRTITIMNMLKIISIISNWWLWSGMKSWRMVSSGVGLNLITLAVSCFIFWPSIIKISVPINLAVSFFIFWAIGVAIHHNNQHDNINQSQHQWDRPWAQLW